MIRMEPVVVNGKCYVSCAEADPPVRTEQDAADLVGGCWEHEASLLMLHAAALSDEFFDLKTRSAGLIVQKLVNYRIRTAIVIPPERVVSERMKEWFAESGARSEFRAFPSAESAEAWLLD